jgi:hypothetical protein
MTFINSLTPIPLGFIIASEGSRAVSLLYFIEMIVYVAAIFIVGRMFGLTAVAFVWLARTVIDTFIIAAMSLQFARRHHAHV